MRYLVTGGAGFIGSNFVRGLLDGRWGAQCSSVRVLDSFTYAGRMENLQECAGEPRLEIVRGSITDISVVTTSTRDVDVVVHFAAESHVDRSISSAHAFIDTNVRGTQVLLDSLRKSPGTRFLHVSTDEVYGSVPSGSSTESDLLQPNSPYSASKASSDLLVRSYVQTFGVDAVITRCSNNFGPYQYPEKLIPRFVTNLMRSRHVPVYGSGANVRDWLHVDDHCRGILLAVAKGRTGEIYNIGGGTELDNLSITRMIVSAMGHGEDMIDHVTDRLGHDLRYSVDWSKAREELGYSPTKELVSELPALIDWYRQNEVWWSPLVTE
jgi:dTDP-glucose 4,6-dehydratase